VDESGQEINALESEDGALKKALTSVLVSSFGFKATSYNLYDRVDILQLGCTSGSDRWKLLFTVEYNVTGEHNPKVEHILSNPFMVISNARKKGIQKFHWIDTDITS
jgi:hypothetical protein